jgi:hypothetical protein
VTAFIQITERSDGKWYVVLSGSRGFIEFFAAPARARELIARYLLD